MDSETVKIKASIDEQGNGAFPSNTNIISHDGVPLRDFINQRVQKTKEGFSLNNNGTVQIDMQNKEWWKITYTGVYYLSNVKDVVENKDGFMIIESLDNAILKYTWKPVTSDNMYTITTGSSGVAWKQITETHTGLMYMNGWTSNGHTAFLTKIGNVVWLNGVLRQGAVTKGTIMATIVVGYRPSSELIALVSAADKTGNVIISTNGNITINIPPSALENVQINAMWTTN